jgi:predicted DNA-binding protein
MLSQPYKADPKKGPFTVSTVKIPTEVSERLGWVATLTGRAKQEILAEALKDYFAKVLEEA